MESKDVCSVHKGCLYFCSVIAWALSVNWACKRRSEIILGVFWTSCIRSVCVLRSGVSQRRIWDPLHTGVGHFVLKVNHLLLIIKLILIIILRDVFRSHLDIRCRIFFDNSYRVKFVDCFCIKHQLGCLTGFWIHLCTQN